MGRRQTALPEYWKLKRKYPAYFDAVEALGTAVRQAGPLDETPSAFQVPALQ